MNGWSNSETWLVNVWGFSDDLTADDFEVRVLMRDSDSDDEDKIRGIAELLENRFDEYIYSIAPKSVFQSILGDFIETSTSRIDWNEIAKTWYSDNKDLFTE